MNNELELFYEALAKFVLDILKIHPNEEISNKTISQITDIALNVFATNLTFYEMYTVIYQTIKSNKSDWNVKGRLPEMIK